MGKSNRADLKIFQLAVINNLASVEAFFIQISYWTPFIYDSIGWKYLNEINHI